eukprot:sb/3471559/
MEAANNYRLNTGGVPVPAKGKQAFVKGGKSFSSSGTCEDLDIFVVHVLRLSSQEMYNIFLTLLGRGERESRKTMRIFTRTGNVFIAHHNNFSNPLSNIYNTCLAPPTRSERTVRLRIKWGMAPPYSPIRTLTTCRFPLTLYPMPTHHMPYTRSDMGDDRWVCVYGQTEQCNLQEPKEGPASL